MNEKSSSRHRFMVNSALKGFVNLCAQASEEELLLIAERIGERSADRAPKGEGPLAESMRTEADTKGGNIQARVIFGGGSVSDYAVVQHEHTNFEHPNGGEAKFLEKTVNEETPYVAGLIGNALRRNVMGGG